MDEIEALLAEQLAYYRSFARHYDIAYMGKPWDRCLDELPIVGDVLELACGTGHWTPLLARRASSVTALDAAPETIAIARRRVGDLPVDFVQADVFGSVHEGERVVPGQTVPSVWRSLADGSDHRVVKVFYTPAELEARLADLGWTARVRETDAGPIVGTAWSHA